MKTIEEIMGLVASAIESAELGEYESHTGREFESAQHKQDCKDIVAEIKSALRELVERKPLSEERIETLFMSTELECLSSDDIEDAITFARLIEADHKIGA